jgi:ribosome-associated translation inhibitor RaiA
MQLRLREVFNAHVRRLRGRLESAALDFARLEGRMEKDPARGTLVVSLRLTLSGGLLSASGEGTDLKAVLSAFDELERRLDRQLVRRSLAGRPMHSAVPQRGERTRL